MKGSFYLKLAWTNLRNNKNTYFPYLLSCSTIIALYYILNAIERSVRVSEFFGMRTIAEILLFSVTIIGFLSFVLVFYTNSFLMKRRKKELGLYSILGMEKRHVACVLFYETAIIGALSIVAGLLSGVLFSQAIYLLLMNIIGAGVSVQLGISFPAIGAAIVLFTAAFFVVMCYNIAQIHLANPISLMQGGRQGEKEPKANWLIAIIGFITLGAGYYFALTVESLMDVLGIFFISVLLVIIGTYCLFTSGSIMALRFLRRNKHFYYKPNHFISVSGMLYRMKQNAVGLATICILSTCVMVTLSSTVCLYVGEEDVLKNRYPRQVATSFAGLSETSEALQQILAKEAEAAGVEIVNEESYYISSFYAHRSENSFMGNLDVPNLDFYQMMVLDVGSYNSLTGNSYQLSPGEILLYLEGNAIEDSITIYGESLKIKGKIEKPIFIGDNFSISHSGIIVMPTVDDIIELRKKNNPNEEIPVWFNLNFDVDGGDDKTKMEFVSSFKSAAYRGLERPGSVTNIFEDRQDFREVYGSLFFIGIFFALLFTMAAVLIIYYKQISEGFDDHDRFQIMQKVGMGKQEVKSTIQSQVLLVFFLPLFMAFLHISVAFPVLDKILQIMALKNTSLFAVCTLCVIMSFAVVYFIVYQATARTYYHLIESEKRS